MHEMNKQPSKRITLWWIALSLTFNEGAVIIDPLDETVASLTPFATQEQGDASASQNPTD